MSLLASETQAKVAACDAALQEVESHLAPLLSRNPSDVSRRLLPLENAELQVSLAYAVASLYFCHLLTQGIDPSDHPIRQELDRIQLYFKKVRAVAEELSAGREAAERIQADTEMAAKRVTQGFAAAGRALAQRWTEAAAGPAETQIAAAVAAAASVEASFSSASAAAAAVAAAPAEALPVEAAEAAEAEAADASMEVSAEAEEGADASAKASATASAVPKTKKKLKKGAKAKARAAAAAAAASTPAAAAGSGGAAAAAAASSQETCALS